MLKALTLEAGEAISILHRPEVEARSVKRRRRQGSIILATALAAASFSDRTALADPLDEYCNAFLVQFCINGHVNPLVCRADPRDCHKPTLYRANPHDPRMQKDPYLVEEYSAAARQYLAAHVEYLMNVYTYGSAAKCKVIINAGDADLMVQMLDQSMFGDDRERPETTFGLIALADDQQLDADRRVAFRNGASDGSCDYWHENPDAVEQMRQTEREALTWAQ